MESFYLSVSSTSDTTENEVRRSQDQDIKDPFINISKAKTSSPQPMGS